MHMKKRDLASLKYEKEMKQKYILKNITKIK